MNGPLHKLKSLPAEGQDHAFFLRCSDEDAQDHSLGIFLFQLAPGGDQFAPSDMSLCRGSGPFFERIVTRTIFARKDIVKITAKTRA